MDPQNDRGTEPEGTPSSSKQQEQKKSAKSTREKDISPGTLVQYHEKIKELFEKVQNAKQNNLTLRHVLWGCLNTEVKQEVDTPLAATTFRLSKTKAYKRANTAIPISVNKNDAENASEPEGTSEDTPRAGVASLNVQRVRESQLWVVALRSAALSDYGCGHVSACFGADLALRTIVLLMENVLRTIHRNEAVDDWSIHQVYEDIHPLVEYQSKYAGDNISNVTPLPPKNHRRKSSSTPSGSEAAKRERTEGGSSRNSRSCIASSSKTLNKSVETGTRDAQNVTTTDSTQNDTIQMLQAELKKQRERNEILQTECSQLQNDLAAARNTGSTATRIFLKSHKPVEKQTTQIDPKDADKYEKRYEERLSEMQPEDRNTTVGYTATKWGLRNIPGYFEVAMEGSYVVERESGKLRKVFGEQ